MAIVYQEPIQAFRFLIRGGDSEEISAAFSRFSGIQMQVELLGPSASTADTGEDTLGDTTLGDTTL